MNNTFWDEKRWVQYDHWYNVWNQTPKEEWRSRAESWLDGYAAAAEAILEMLSPLDYYEAKQHEAYSDLRDLMEDLMRHTDTVFTDDV